MNHDFRSTMKALEDAVDRLDEATALGTAFAHAGEEVARFVQLADQLRAEMRDVVQPEMVGAFILLNLLFQDGRRTALRPEMGVVLVYKAVR